MDVKELGEGGKIRRSMVEKEKKRKESEKEEREEGG